MNSSSTAIVLGLIGVLLGLALRKLILSADKAWRQIEAGRRLRDEGTMPTYFKFGGQDPTDD